MKALPSHLRTWCTLIDCNWPQYFAGSGEDHAVWQWKQKACWWNEVYLNNWASKLLMLWALSMPSSRECTAFQSTGRAQRGIQRSSASMKQAIKSVNCLRQTPSLLASSIPNTGHTLPQPSLLLCIAFYIQKANRTSSLSSLKNWIFRQEGSEPLFLCLKYVVSQLYSLAI